MLRLEEDGRDNDFGLYAPRLKVVCDIGAEPACDKEVREEFLEFDENVKDSGGVEDFVDDAV